MFFCRTKGPQVSLVSICAERWTWVLRPAQEKRFHVMYCSLPQYEAKSWASGDPGGLRSRKPHLERVVTLPVRPQGQIMARIEGFEPSQAFTPLRVFKTHLFSHLSISAYGASEGSRHPISSLEDWNTNLCTTPAY